MRDFYTLVWGVLYFNVCYRNFNKWSKLNDILCRIGIICVKVRIKCIKLREFREEDERGDKNGRKEASV